MKPSLIGLVGYAGSGKSTIAEQLWLTHNYTRYSLAARIKSMLCMGLGIGLSDVYDTQKKDEPCEALCGQTPRYAMQTLGTEWGRQLIHPDIWIRTLLNQITRDRLLNVTYAVIDDVRFLNEANAIKAAGGVLWKVIGCHTDIGTKAQLHLSEQELKKIPVDDTIFNDGSLAYLQVQVDTLIGAIP